MKIGIHGKKISKEAKEFVGSVLEKLAGYPCTLHISEVYFKQLQKNHIKVANGEVYRSNQAPVFLDLLITLGGDGTLLEAVTHVGRNEIPILGINTGRMGFLATTAKDTIDEALK